MFKAVIGSEYPKHVIPLIKNARKNIDIVMYDWRWYENQPGHTVQQFNIALVEAVNRGVQVRAILNDSKLLKLLNDLGIKAKCLSDRRTLHTKLILLDSSICIIGSHNMTRNGFASNIETSLIIDIPEGETRLFEFFNNIYKI